MRWGARLVALIGISLLAWPGAASPAGVPPQLNEAESQALAGVAAERALAAFAVPLGAVASPSGPFVEPRAEPFLSRLPPNTIQVHSWWLSSQTPGQLIGYVQAHPPAGFQVTATGNFEGSPPTPGIPTLPTEVNLDAPAVPRARGEISVQVAAARRPGAGTAIEVSSDVRWLTPRPASEAVPPGSTLLRITVHPDGFVEPRARTRQRPLSITGRSRIERVATLVNALPLVQRLGVASPCPPPRGVVLRLAFYRGARSAPVAVVRDNIVSCGAVQLELAGHEEPALEEGFDLAQEVSEAIGTRLDTRLTEPRGR
jgi:hypothetical protein